VKLITIFYHRKLVRRCFPGHLITQNKPTLVFKSGLFSDMVEAISRVRPQKVILVSIVAAALVLVASVAITRPRVDLPVEEEVRLALNHLLILSPERPAVSEVIGGFRPQANRI
jgi:hypothetical protein